MAITWQQTPLGKATWSPGQRWNYRLPVAEQTAAPSVRWQCDLLPSTAVVSDAADPFRVTISVPADADERFGELVYEIQDVEGPVRGRILVRIRSESPASSGTEPGTTSGRESRSGEIPQPPEEARKGDLTKTETKQNLDGSGMGPGKEDRGPLEPEPLPPALRGTFHVAVVRNGVVVPTLKTALPLARTITIGKSSSRYGTPDLDLQGQFETDELEAACSRRQAEVFWSEQRIWIKTLGKLPLKFLGPDGNPGPDVPASHCWQPDQILILPGKLRLVLRQERS